jgi:catechol 2,3-dioxygenase-like lactoylglutathione lyase family enzyme
MAPRFQVIGFVVADMAASLAFYRALGLELPAEADGEPHVSLEIPGGPTIAWDTQDTIRSFDASWTPPPAGHRMSVAFACDDPADVDATHDKLVAAGYRSHLDPWDAFWGQRYATLLDPDDNAVDLFAPLS